ncbi:Zinc (Zn2)-Iron (Fe2) Permease (ZIP) Family [Phytophthora palmivora]|uniref:Zinc (Zn2)-Iron (Fe2) Permease (ZIP) Family n=1 Tax=Phytophthora palmivora TaxID=4796 RepID=A0A2P4XT68_9STRA|nr:Zinc (Zn2)-Iron (Fe2) Permease (ZIP) Family [Phytophthora palmivora]
MGGQARLHVLLLAVALLSVALLSTADDGTLLVTPAVRGEEHLEADPIKPNAEHGLGNQEKQQPLLRVFLSFAAGGLLGDALLHLLPHSLPEGAGHAHDHGHNHDHEGPGHSHSMADLYRRLEEVMATPTDTLIPRRRCRMAESKDDAEVPDNEPITSLETGKKPIAAAGYLNLAADFSHNFTDGLAIGATFLRGTGWTTTVAMLLHELPHEIGDFAILIQSGFTRREAMATQLLTAIGAMIGTVIGLLMEGAGDSSSVWISPFTAGGFIYIACTSVMPELLEDCSLAQSLKEAVAMCAGIGLMALIALNE